MPLTWQDLKAALPIESWDDVTQGDDSLGDRFLDRARAWLSARLGPCGVSSWDEDGDAVIRQILLYRALYEFYAYVERESMAFDKRDSAMEMLRGRFGPCVDAAGQEQMAGQEQGAGLPVGAIAAGRTAWQGY